MSDAVTETSTFDTSDADKAAFLTTTAAFPSWFSIGAQFQKNSPEKHTNNQVNVRFALLGALSDFIVSSSV
jgi:hypothetical protein